MDSARAAEVEALKKVVIERYQHDLKHEKYVELHEKLQKIDARNQRNRLPIFNLNAELQALNYDPVEDPQKVVARGIIQQHAQELISHFEASAAAFKSTDLIACMMCEVALVNFLNFLNTFQVTVGESRSLPSNSDAMDSEKDQLIANLEKALKETQSTITKYERQQGKGLKVQFSSGFTFWMTNVRNLT